MAGELFNWIKKHNKTRDQLRDSAHGQARDQESSGQQRNQRLPHFTSFIQRLFSEESPEDSSKRALLSHARHRRGVTDNLEGESIQEVMTNLMNAPHKETKQRKHETKKITKHKLAKVSKLKKKSKTTKSKSTKPSKRILKNKNPKKKKPAKRSDITKPQIKKSPALPNFLKMIAADPTKKSIISNLGSNFHIDLKSLKIINKIPKPVLKNLLKNIDIKKYVRLSNLIPKGMKISTKKNTFKGKSTAKNMVEKNTKIIKGNVLKAKKTKVNKKKIGKKSKIKSTRLKKKAKVTKLLKRKGHVQKKHAKKTPSGNTETKHDHAQLSFLKEKIKKTNSLKLKVAKALLEHCETQNKLRKIFENVNNSLKEATRLAKTIGKKYGIKKADVDKMSTEHTEQAVGEFLDKFF